MALWNRKSSTHEKSSDEKGEVEGWQIGLWWPEMGKIKAGEGAFCHLALRRRTCLTFLPQEGHLIRFGLITANRNTTSLQSLTFALFHPGIWGNIFNGGGGGSLAEFWLTFNPFWISYIFHLNVTMSFKVNHCKLQFVTVLNSRLAAREFHPIHIYKIWVFYTVQDQTDQSSLDQTLFLCCFYDLTPTRQKREETLWSVFQSSASSSLIAMSKDPFEAVT